MRSCCQSPGSVLSGLLRLCAGCDAYVRSTRRFDGFAEETVTVQRLPGWFKQRSNRLYPVQAPARGQTPRLSTEVHIVVENEVLAACRDC
jgi:hypothetical protein